MNSEDAPLTVLCGKIYDYLGMTLDYSLYDKVKITMLGYIEGFLIYIPSSVEGNIVTAGSNHLFGVGYDTLMLQPNYSKIYYHRAM